MRRDAQGCAASFAVAFVLKRMLEEAANKRWSKDKNVSKYFLLLWPLWALELLKNCVSSGAPNYSG
jgi:hypothetical protein